MKRIVVPVDFSAHAQHALTEAVKLASTFSAEVFVVHAFRAINRADTIKSVSEMLHRETQDALDDLISRVEVPPNVPITAKAVNGEPVEVIEQFVEKMAADLIIIGTQGEMSDPDVFLGSVTGALIKETDIPILIVPREGHLADIKQILLTVKSLIIRYEDQLTPLKTLQHALGASISLLQIKTPDLTEADHEISPYLSALSLPTDCLEAENVSAGLSHYLGAHPVDLICVLRRKRKFFEILFTRSATKKEQFSSSLPMLILKGHQ